MRKLSPERSFYFPKDTQEVSHGAGIQIQFWVILESLFPNYSADYVPSYSIKDLTGDPEI